MKKIIGALILITQFCSAAWAQSFVIRDIQFEGLEHIPPATVESYLPVKRGQTLQPNKTSVILRSLYKTGFFDQITLSREGNTLIIHVIERPTIGQLRVTGNSVIPTDKLMPVLKSLDIAEGRVYNPAMLERVKQSLLNQYYQLGRYNARVNVRTSPMARNQVAVTLDISEGVVAKIKRISIIGNQAFPEKTLVKQLDVTTSGLLTFYTQTDRYSESQLEASLEKLRAYYLDRGYLRYEVRSTQAEVTPDRKAVYITIVVDEGAQYTVSGYDVQGNLILPKEDYLKQINIKPGETFSRQKVLDAEKNISKMLGNQGYLFATVTIKPQVNEATHQVYLIFEIKTGKRTYVRHISFSDNNRTNDVVLRREMEQWESAPASSIKLERSKHRLSLLPYIRDVELAVAPVPETDDQVDVNYKIKEDSSAQASFKVGYSQIYRMILAAGLNQKNVFGTGNTLGINFSRSKYEQFYGVEFTDPYYTADGISRSFNLAVSRTDPGAATDLVNSYTTNQLDLGVQYGIPIGQEKDAFNRIIAGVTYQNTLINLNKKNPDLIAAQVMDFINRHGRRFQELDFRLGYTRESRDRAVFPTRGSLQTLFADIFVPASSGSLSFYMLNYHGKWYQPLTDQFIFTYKADLGYGNGFSGINDFPFFRNYYAGGIDSVRGYQGFTLGPRDSNGKAFGGNMLVDGSLGLIFPNHLSDNLRTSVFVDAGNVYSSLNMRKFGGESSNSGPIRYSAGIEADWITPFGPIELSLAQPLNRRPHDDRETFQFALGANF